jgi:hypothetical protein
MDAWTKYDFKENPFSILPGQTSGPLIWAGLQNLKKKYDSVLEEILENESSRLVLVASRWGGGKTHAANFYSTSENLPLVGNSQHNLSPLSCIVITPKEGNNAAYEFYKKVLEGFDIENIANAIRSMRRHDSDEEALNTIQDWSEGRDIGKILWLLGDEDDDKAFAASELLFNKPTAKVRRDLRIRRGIEDTTDRFRVLSTVFKILSKYTEGDKLTKERKILLWIDEIESLILYTSKQYVPFSQAIRELIDMTKKNFGLFLNFSLTDMDDLRTLDFIIGSALKDRINSRIIFEELDVERSLAYVIDRMKAYRRSEYDNSPTYPFTKEALEELLKLGSEKTSLPLTPRVVNKWCEATINKAASSSLKEINKEFIFDLRFVGDEIL